MGNLHSISFLIAPLDNHDDVISLIPEVDGTPLTRLLEDYERMRGYEPAGGYGGLIPSWFNYGPLERYFMGENSDEIWRQGYYLLGCVCGEVGCWPLVTRIELEEQQVIWREFCQPFRPERDYASFGPFKFDRQQYSGAVADLASHFS